MTELFHYSFDVNFHNPKVILICIAIVVALLMMLYGVYKCLCPCLPTPCELCQCLCKSCKCLLKYLCCCKKNKKTNRDNDRLLNENV